MVLMFSFVRTLMVNLHISPRLTARGPCGVTGQSRFCTLALGRSEGRTPESSLFFQGGISVNPHSGAEGQD